MRELKKEFIGKGQVRGFEFTQVKKTEFGYIYKIDTKDSVLYEVFKRKVNNRYNCISYPSNKAFGVWAWTTNDINKAKSILEDIKIKKESFDFNDGSIVLGKEVTNG